MVSKLRIIRKQTVEVEDPFQNFVMREVDTGAEERFSHLNLACQLPRRRQDKNTRPVQPAAGADTAPCLHDERANEYGCV